MAAATQTIDRDNKGRFRAGCSGNPAGKKPGTRNRLEPKPRGRPIHLEIPEGESPAGAVVATFNAALRAMAAGEITRARGRVTR